MSNRLIPKIVMASTLLVAASVLPLPALADPNVTQTFELSPGWNAIYVEVDPEDGDPALVFQGVPLLGLWYWSVPDAPADTLPDPVDGLPQAEGWLHYFPDPPESFTNHLFDVQPNKVYLVEVGGSAPATLTVNGRPSVRRENWVADAFNLVGASVVPGGEPTYADYFESSDAHRGQPIYTLDPAGTWALTDPSSHMTAGEGFWVFSSGGSDYPGPIGLEVPSGDGIVFATLGSRLGLRVRNRSDESRVLSVNVLGGGGTTFAYESETDPGDFELNTTWSNLSDVPPTALAAGDTWLVRLSSRTESLSSNICSFESEVPGKDCSRDSDCTHGTCGLGVSATLEILDGAGSRRLVPILAESAAVSGAAKAASGAATCQTGLWVGTISVDRVAEVHCDEDLDPGCRTRPTATDPVTFEGVGEEFDLYEGQRNTFQQRVLLHQDDGGQLRMLQQAIEMFEDDESGLDDARGTPLLLTRDDKIPLFEGSTMRDGVRVGRRVSTVAFRWDEDPPPLQDPGGVSLPPAEDDYDGSGLTPETPATLTPGATLNFTITLPGKEPGTPPSPHNPYYHRYHPDHGVVTLQKVCDGGPFECQACSSDADCGAGTCNSIGLQCAADIPTITRNIVFRIDAADPEEGDQLDFGCGRLTGVYSEVIEGLHGSPLHTSGRFRIDRLSPIGLLNPEPNQ